MSVPYDTGFGGSHSGPALQRRMILVDGGHHHFANFERLLSAGVSFVGQDLADIGKPVLAVFVMRKRLHVASDGIGGGGAARKALPRVYVCVIVMPEQNMAGFINRSEERRVGKASRSLWV